MDTFIIITKPNGDNKTGPCVRCKEDNIPDEANHHKELFSDHCPEGWCWECTDQEWDDIREDSNRGDSFGYSDDDEGLIDFAEPGSNSALRAATEDNPRNQPCPNCNTPDVLTPLDVSLNYQCNRCADRIERGFD